MKKFLFKSLSSGIFTLLLFPNQLFSTPIKECQIDNKIMLAILLTETTNYKTYKYPYIISLNRKIDKKILKNTQIKKFFISSRTIDCQNKKTCKTVVKILWDLGIKNLDLGAFQINSKFHKHPIENYFDLGKSYKIACNYVSKNIKKYGYTWYAIAGYHSFTPKENAYYQNALKRNYEKIVEITGEK